MLATVTTVKVDVNLLSFAAGIAIPFLTALLAKQKAPDWLKWGLLTLLSAVGGTLATLIANNGVFAWQTTLFAMVTTWVAALAAHYGYNVSGLQTALEAHLFPGFGFGATTVTTSATPTATPQATVTVEQSLGLTGGTATVTHTVVQAATDPITIPTVVHPPGS